MSAAADYGSIFDVAQLAHVELLTPHLERSLWFFRDLLGMEEVARKDGAVHLRAFDGRYLI
ncbi:MAG: VOC family protein [Thermomicrobium sp.]